MRAATSGLADTIGRDAALRPRRQFTDAALDLYGVYELQTLEGSLRDSCVDTMAIVAGAIRRKAGIADDGDDHGFLTDCYLALYARLETGMLVGRRRHDKFDSAPFRA